MKTVKDIVAEYLKANGYDGLCTLGCCCGFDSDEFAEGCSMNECLPAYKNTATEEDKSWIQCDVGDIIYTTEKPQ